MNLLGDVADAASQGVALPWPWWISVFLILPLIDAQNVFAYFRPPLPLASPIDADPDYTFIIPLFGHPRYFAARDRLEQYKEHVILSVNIAAPMMAEAADRWQAEGWRVSRCVIEDRLAPNELIAAALPMVDTAYAIRLDGDSAPLQDPALAIATLKRRTIDCASVVVVSSQHETLAERMQTLEYAIAMRTRHYRPWLTSGACMILRTGLYREVVARHSNFFLGEDIEVGRIALWLGANCGHVALDVETDVPSTFRSIFRQRRGWWCGSFRLAIVNIDRNLQVPGFFLYSTLFVWLLLPFKLAALVVAPEVVPLLVVEYMALTLVVNWPVRSRYMILLPYYALVQALVMPLFGVARWISLSRESGRCGRMTIGAWPSRDGRALAALDAAPPDLPALEVPAVQVSEA